MTKDNVKIANSLIWHLLQLESAKDAVEIYKVPNPMMLAAEFCNSEDIYKKLALDILNEKIKETQNRLKDMGVEID